MDYYIDPTEMFPSTEQHRTVLDSSANLRLLENVFDDRGSSWSPRCLHDCILVSVDIGCNGRRSVPRKLESIGISVLDTRSLRRVSNGIQQGSLLQTSLYLLSGKSISLKSGIPQYLFGVAEQLQPDRDVLYEKLINLLSPSDEMGGRRNVILVGHNIVSDVMLLRSSMNIDLRNIPAVCALIDTQHLLSDLHNFSRTRLKMSLQHTLSHLGIRKMYLHNSGNDAHFTLQALLLLFCKWKSEKELYNFSQSNEKAKLYWAERLQILTYVGRHWSGVIPAYPKTMRRRKGKGKLEKTPMEQDIWTEGSDTDTDLLTMLECED